MQDNTNSAASTPSNSMPVKDLYELMIVWLKSSLCNKYYVLDLLWRMESAGIQLPRGLRTAISEGDFLGKTDVEILKNHIAAL